MTVIRCFVNRNLFRNILKAKYSRVASNESHLKIPDYIDFTDNWPETEKEKILDDFIVIPNFVSQEEEEAIIQEIDPYMKRLKYEFDHWDDAIHGFRETERKQWYPHNKKIIEKIGQIAFKGEILPHIHILDLAENDDIFCLQPTDSQLTLFVYVTVGFLIHYTNCYIPYCGSTIAGLSLLSDSIMRLVRTDETKYLQTKDSSNSDEYRSLPKVNATLENAFHADVLLKQRSLYIMRDTSRYNFTHEILGNDNGFYKGNKINKTRRISVICRNNPQQ